MTIAFLGCGRVGAPLADHLQRAGHRVVLATADVASGSVTAARQRNAALEIDAPRGAVAGAEVVFLATPFQVNADVLAPLTDVLGGKVLVDCTNPVGPGLSHGLGNVESGSALVQRLVPAARVVKAFSIYGFENFEDPTYADYDSRPAMLYCGDDLAAKADVGDLIADCGFEPVDVGGLAQALHLEHMTLLWVRMVRMQGHSPHLVWSALRRPRSVLPYSKLVVLGDGLSDQGRFGTLTQRRYPPSPPFFGGRWTNGPTWVERLARLSRVPLAAEDNFAQGGATTGVFNINEPLRAALGLDATAPIRGVLAQVDALIARDGTLDPHALYILWAGGHDIGAYLEFGQPDLAAQPPEDNIHRAVEMLSRAGARQFFLGNLPDISRAPSYAETPNGAKARELVDAYNAGLQRAATDLRQTHGLDVIVFDGAAAFADIAAEAERYGIAHLTEAFLPLDTLDFANPLAAPGPLPKDRDGVNPDAFLFFWAVSAGRRVHAVLAQRALAALSRHEHA
jgi:hypothetical protein